tara:strand:+ start:3555 stop:3761 length:207 start_codon:yes stop_codon:yes gene_type:complete
MSFTETLRPNMKVWLVNEIIRLRVLNNTPVNFEKIKPANDVKEWLFTHSFKELMDMQVNLIAKLKERG